jgi:hypothetical protein
MIFGFFAIIGRLVYGIVSFSEFFTNVAFNDGNCNLLGGDDYQDPHDPRGLKGSEDFSLGRLGLLFISSGDLRVVAERGSAAANPGGIWAVDATMKREDEPFKIPLHGYPIEKEFAPHGIYVSNMTDRLYVVNHGNQNSTVEVFFIEYCNGGWSSCEFPANGLLYLTTVSSNLFPYFGINDVVEGKPEWTAASGQRMDSKELYVTRFLPYPLAAAGWRESLFTLDSIRNILTWLVGLRRTQVFRCTFGPDEEPSCEDATGMLFRSANGMTVDQARGRYFVCDTLARRVTVFDREEGTGMLRTNKGASFDSLHPCDNIEYDADNGELIIGTIVKPYMALGVIAGGGSGVAPGGMVVATECTDPAVNCAGGSGSDGSASIVSGGWLVREVRMHNGNKLPLISAAARFGDHVFLGSFSSTGFLVCEDNEPTPTNDR